MEFKGFLIFLTLLLLGACSPDFSGLNYDFDKEFMTSCVEEAGQQYEEYCSCTLNNLKNEYEVSEMVKISLGLKSDEEIENYNKTIEKIANQCLVSTSKR